MEDTRRCIGLTRPDLLASARELRGEFEALLGEVLGSETWKIGAAKLDRWFIRQGVQPNNAVAMELAHALNKAFR